MTYVIMILCILWYHVADLPTNWQGSYESIGHPLSKSLESKESSCVHRVINVAYNAEFLLLIYDSFYVSYANLAIVILEAWVSCSRLFDL